MLLSLWWACAHPPTPAESTPPATTPDPAPPTPALWVSAYRTGSVFLLDPVTGKRLDQFDRLAGAQAVRWGPDGTVYVVAEEAGEVRQWRDGRFRRFLSEPLQAPTGIAFGDDGTVYVGDYAADAIHAFDASGAFLRTVTTEVDGPDAGLMMGADGHLWVPCFEANAVVRVDPDSGAITPWLSDIASPRMLQETPDAVWLTSWRGDAIQTTTPDKSIARTFATVSRPSGLHVDEGGVWVTSDQTPTVIRLDAEGEAEATFDLAPLGAEGLTFLAWGPPPEAHATE